MRRHFQMGRLAAHLDVFVPQPEQLALRGAQEAVDEKLEHPHVMAGDLEAAFPGIFPPLPGAFAEWGTILADRPDLKPGIQRLDDGLATRMDRTAAAGNGVVPLAAARA